MEPESLAVLAAVGFAAALADYVAGVGFGVVAASVMVALLGWDPREAAAAASLAQMASIPVVTYRNRSRGLLRGDPTVAASIAAGATATAVAASWLVAGIDAESARTIFALALAPLAAVVALGGRGARPGGAAGGRRVAPALAGGALAGLEKALTGGGFTPVLVAVQVLTGVDVRSAIAAAPAIKALPLLAVTAVYGAHGYLDPAAAAAVAAGAVAAALPAPRLLGSAPEGLLRAAVAGGILAASGAVLLG